MEEIFNLFHGFAVVLQPYNLLVMLFGIVLGVMIGVLPVGKRFSGDSAQATFFWSLKSHDFPRWKAHGLASWRDRVARLWPQTEWLKAALVQYQRTGNAADVEAAYAALRAYLDKPAEGLWRDRMLEDGSLIDEPAPASSLYHIALALAELIRVAQGN